MPEQLCKFHILFVHILTFRNNFRDVVYLPFISEFPCLYVYCNIFPSRRYVSDRNLFNSWTSAAEKLDVSRFALGGNAPVMAKRFAIEGCSVLLGSKMSARAAKNLHSDIVLASNATSDQVDDIHLLLEYDKDEKWGKYVSPRGNRLIVHSDYSNLMMESLSDFIAEVVTFKPNLVVVSGLQMMDNFPFELDIRSRKINELKNFLISLPLSTLIHFEMASIVEEKFLKEIIYDLLPNVDSLGMNEQELANLVGVVTGKSVTHVANCNPRVATALDDMRQLLSSLLKLQNGSRQVSRLHVHTLAYQAIVTQENSKWKHSEMAAAKAALTANRYVCGSIEIDPNKMRLVLDQSFAVSVAAGSERIAVDQNDPVSCWNENGYNICVAPNLVCTHILQTGGAGDNISAVGVASQL